MQMLASKAFFGILTPAAYPDHSEKKSKAYFQPPCTWSHPRQSNPNPWFAQLGYTSLYNPTFLIGIWERKARSKPDELRFSQPFALPSDRPSQSGEVCEAIEILFGQGPFLRMDQVYQGFTQQKIFDRMMIHSGIHDHSRQVKKDIIR